MKKALLAVLVVSILILNGCSQSEPQGEKGSDSTSSEAPKSSSSSKSNAPEKNFENYRVVRHGNISITIPRQWELKEVNNEELFYDMQEENVAFFMVSEWNVSDIQGNLDKKMEEAVRIIKSSFEGMEEYSTEKEIINGVNFTKLHFLFPFAKGESEVIIYIYTDEELALAFTFAQFEEISNEYEKLVTDAAKTFTLKGSTSSQAPKSSSSASPKETMGQKNALAQAKMYLEVAPFSRKGLIKQLEYEKYSTADAEYAVDNCKADWKKQASLKAKAYLELMAFSRESLIDQLKYDGYTTEQAEYGVTQNGY